MSLCNDLIGMPYELGADGSNGKIDCIHLCYEVLERLGIDKPKFKDSWYQATTREVARDLLSWGSRVKTAEYDGDILLLKQPSWAFAITWQTGILYINRHVKAVSWCSVQSVKNYHCFRMKSS